MKKEKKYTKVRNKKEKGAMANESRDHYLKEKRKQEVHR